MFVVDCKVNPVAAGWPAFDPSTTSTVVPAVVPEPSVADELVVVNEPEFCCRTVYGTPAAPPAPAGGSPGTYTSTIACPGVLFADPDDPVIVACPTAGPGASAVGDTTVSVAAYVSGSPVQVTANPAA